MSKKDNDSRMFTKLEDDSTRNLMSGDRGERIRESKKHFALINAMAGSYFYPFRW